MGDASFKHGSFQARFVYVGVEMVATHVRELNDVRFGDGVLGRRHCVAHAKFLEVLSEHVRLAFRLGRTRLKLCRDGGQHGGVPLDGGALHVVPDASQASHFFATAGTAWSAMHQQRHGRPMPRAFTRALAVQHKHAPVHVGRFTHEGGCRLGVVGGDAAAQRTFSFFGQSHRFFNAYVGHQGAHRAKRFHLVA